MKVLLVSPFTSISGSAIRFRHIAEHLARLGFDVVYVERRPKDQPVPRLQGVRYHSSPTLSNRYLDISLSLIYNLWLLGRNLGCSVYYALKPAPNNGIPALVAKLLGKRVFLDIDDLDYGYLPTGCTRELSRLVFDHLPGRFDLVTCHTLKLRDYIVNHLQVSEQRVYLLPQGVSDVFLDYDIGHRPADIPPSIVYAATLGITSDFGDMLPVLAKICGRHADLVINVVGDGVRRKEFERNAAELDITRNICFHGRVAHERLPELMGANRIGLNYMRPTQVNDCRAILKIREYLAVGLEVVCNDVGDARAFLPYVHIEPDIQAMGRRLDALLGGNRSHNRSGRAFVEEHFRWEKLVAEWAGWADLQVPTGDRARGVSCT